MSEETVCALLLYVVAACPLLIRASVQTPTIASCSSEETFLLNNVTIENAKIGQKMTVRFSLTIKESLASEPKLHVTINATSDRKGSKSKTLGCIADIGSCTYDLCGKQNAVEKLSQMWNNKCPIPETTLEKSIDVVIPVYAEFLIGRPPLTLSIQLEVINGGKTVGCQSFKVHIAAR